MMTLKWGIIGCGNVAEFKGGPALYGVDGSELIAVMRRDGAKAQDFAQRHGAKRWYDRVETLLADPEINAVYVATPVHAHCQQTIQAAEAGKHVLCEKPMAMDVAECQRMIDACKASGVKLMIAYYRRTYPVVQRMRALLKQGIIGETMLVRINLTSYHPAGRDDDWRVQPETGGGGVLYDVGSHRLDALNYLLGPIAQVSAITETLHADYSVEDSAVLILKLANGMHGVANFQWNIGHDMDDFEIYGTQGAMLARPLEGGHLEVYRQGERIETYDMPRPKITHWGLIENFVAAVRSDEPIICTGKDGLETNRVMAAAYRDSAKR